MYFDFIFTGLTHIEITVGALIEVIHAFASTDLDNVGLATKLYVQLLNCDVSIPQAIRCEMCPCYSSQS